MSHFSLSFFVILTCITLPFVPLVFQELILTFEKCAMCSLAKFIVFLNEIYYISWEYFIRFLKQSNNSELPRGKSATVHIATTA